MKIQVFNILVIWKLSSENRKIDLKSYLKKVGNIFRFSKHLVSVLSLFLGSIAPHFKPTTENIIYAGTYAKFLKFSAMRIYADTNICRYTTVQ